MFLGISHRGQKFITVYFKHTTESTVSFHGIRPPKWIKTLLFIVTIVLLFWWESAQSATMQNQMVCLKSEYQKSMCFIRQNQKSTRPTTVFVDTRLSKTKHPWKSFQNYHQSCMLLTDRIEIHQSQPASMRQRRSKVTLVAVIGGFWSDLSITRKTDGNFVNVSAGVLFSKVAYQWKRWKSDGSCFINYI